MNLFKWKTLLYLSFHAIGFLLGMISIMGIPGEIDNEKPTVKLIMSVLNFLLPLAWYGIPALVTISILAFYFNYSNVGKICSIISLLLGSGLLLGMVILYNVK